MDRHHDRCIVYNNGTDVPYFLVKRKNIFYKALVDQDIYDRYKSIKWYLGTNGYVVAAIGYGRKGRHMVYLHKYVIPDKGVVDHINRDKLDNRRSNLRLGTHQNNMWNVGKINKPTTSKYKGVYWHRIGKGAWRARIRIGKRFIHLGLFDKEEEARDAYIEACKTYRSV